MMLIIVGHLALSILAAFLGSKTNKQERFTYFIIALFFPVGGLITVLTLYFSRSHNIKEIDEAPEIKNTVVLFADRINIEKEINIVPLEETLLINDPRIKRQQLIDTLKKDFGSYIDRLKIALRDEDIETSHYAASAVSEIRRKLDLRIQAFAVLYEKDKADPEVSKEYAAALEEYLNSKLLEDNRRKQMIYTYIHVLEAIVAGEEGSPDYYSKLIMALFESGDYEKAGKYCKVYLEEYENEEAYILNLKYNFLIRDKNTFDIILNSLKKSPVKLSNKGINIVRFWLDGVK